MVGPGAPIGLGDQRPALQRRDARRSTPRGAGTPGGVNTLMADGSVKFIKDTINVVTWRALGSISGGEVLSSDSY